MSMTSPLNSPKIALLIGCLGLAAVSIGATSPDYPDLGRGDQMAAATGCDLETMDGIRVCAPRHGSSASVTTLTPGLSIVR